MLIFATVGISLTALATWSAIHGQNGFREVAKLIRGEPAFVVSTGLTTISSPSEPTAPSKATSTQPVYRPGDPY